MLITPKSTITMPDGTVYTSAKVKVFDCVGQQIPYVISYDTETQEAEIVLNLRKKNAEESKSHIGGFALTDTDSDSPIGCRSVATFKGVIKGSYVEVNGERFLGL